MDKMEEEGARVEKGGIRRGEKRGAITKRGGEGEWGRRKKRRY